MGQYVITIMGQGPHHNSDESGGTTNDADELAAALVASLKSRGHTIYDASFISTADGGLRDNLETREEAT